jgi:hypothetical protein
MSDPLRAAVVRRREAKQRQRERPDEPPPTRPYLTQGALARWRRLEVEGPDDA